VLGRVPLSWIRGSEVCILSSFSSLILPSLLARVLRLRASLGFFPPCFSRNLFSWNLISIPPLGSFRSCQFHSLPLQLHRPFLLSFYATCAMWPSRPPPVASPPFADQNPRSSAFCRRLLINLPSQLEASIASSSFFLSFHGVSTRWRARSPPPSRLF
jgi:hypothetical protein